jgi:hypothetical protein
MNRCAVLCACALFSSAAAVHAQRPAPIPTPASVLGFEPGTDRRLVQWDTIARYFEALGAASNRVSVRSLGRTTHGNPFIVAFISSPANLARLTELRSIQQRLADPRTIPDSATAARLIAQGRTFVLITSSVHSTEVGGFFSPLEIAHRLATAPTATERAILDSAVVMLVPSLNPDGVNIVTRWYHQTLGTPAEGSGPPELYHPYVGHDNNRDWYVFTQPETRMVVDSLYGVWKPQVTMDIHQQSPSGARLFIPPYMDPIEPNVDPLLVQSVNALGLEIARRMTAAGFLGISVNSTYDAWTPARAYQHYHGAVRILTETASASLATPITLNPDSLRAQRGVNPRVASWNFVAPWRGGRWAIADIIRYQTAGAMGMLDHVARNADSWRWTSYRVLQRATGGWEGWPWAYVIPTTGQDLTSVGALLDIMRRGQVEVRQALQPFNLGGERHSPGTWIITLRQPYAAFAKALLEVQEYPDLREYPGGPPQRPYDVTAHTLPLLLGVRAMVAQDSLPTALSAPIQQPPTVYRARALANGGGRPLARVGLYRSWTASMDEGWTRWIFETWSVPFESVTDSAIRAGNLGASFDALVIPDMNARQIVEGLSPRVYPARYAGGLGQQGVQALRDFVDGGGTLITFNRSSLFAIAALELPVTDALAAATTREFYAPGSIFRVELDRDHPIAAGMPAHSIAWFESGPAFEVRDPTRVRIVGRYPANASEVLLSGWVLGAERVAGKGALLEARRGRGRVILFGFRPQYRAQTLATYPAVFNAIATSTQGGR